jgi:hypothetical protein
MRLAAPILQRTNSNVDLHLVPCGNPCSNRCHRSFVYRGPLLPASYASENEVGTTRRYC